MHRTQIKQNRKTLLSACQKHLPKNVYRQLAKGIGNAQQVGISSEVEYKIAYAAKPKQWYNQQSRCRTTLQRYLTRQILPKSNDNRYPKMTHDDIEKSCRKIMVDCFGAIEDKFEIVTGSAITAAYCDGFGGSSCMTGSESKFVEIYANNPDKVALVKYYGDIDARALLWSTDTGQRVLDRIYPNDGLHIDIIRQWATDRGYSYRASTSLPDESYITLSDEKLYNVTLKMAENEYMPYMDTFCFFDFVGDNKIVCSNDNNCRDYIAQNTCGHYTSENHIGCCECGEYINIDDSYTHNDNTYCSNCFYDEFIVCDNCGDTEPRGGSVYCNDMMYCEHCADNNLIYCEDCGEYALDDDAQAIHRGNNDYAVCSDCLANYTYCEDCQEYFYDDCETHTIDGKDKTVCSGCLEECVQCEDCQEYFTNTTEFDSCDYCENCYENIKDKNLCGV